MCVLWNNKVAEAPGGGGEEGWSPFVGFVQHVGRDNFIAIMSQGHYCKKFLGSSKYNTLIGIRQVRDRLIESPRHTSTVSISSPRKGEKVSFPFQHSFTEQ